MAEVQSSKFKEQNCNSKLEFEDLLFLPTNRIIILDIDGTLVCDGESVCSREVEAQVSKLRQTNQVYLCTNSRRDERTRQMAEALGVRPLISRHRKPSRKILRDIGCSGLDCVVIGDKLLTDAWFAWRVGAEFIPVRRKVSGQEILYVKILYWIDKVVQFFYEKTKT